MPPALGLAHLGAIAMVDHARTMHRGLLAKEWLGPVHCDACRGNASTSGDTTRTLSTNAEPPKPWAQINAIGIC
jgi:hypothetical protein